MIQITFFFCFPGYTSHTKADTHRKGRLNMITNQMKLSDIVKAYPRAIDIFNDFHIDYCCGGKDRLEDALKELSIDPKSFIDLMNKKLADTKIKTEGNEVLLIEQLTQMNVPDLIDYIVTTYHDKERNLIAEIDGLMNKVLLVHYEHNHSQLVPLHSLFSDLRKELEEHFAKEEKLVFPYMKKTYLESSNDGYVKELEDEHDAAGNIIKEITACTNDFKAPEGACTSYRMLFGKLDELTKDIFNHIFTENSLLFPKYEGGR
jgi:regulator of cell morphogenesis and NO signaling